MKVFVTWTVLLLCLGGAVMAAEPDAPIADDKDSQKLFHETYRPQFHYTMTKGWINDPIGMVYYKGQYHLFNDHNPASRRFPGGRTSGEQSHWSHAVSPDLVHWKHMPIAVLPDKLGACWSGSGVVDWNNTAGLQTGEDKTLVLLYTSAGKTFTQSLVYSNDRGRTWTKYEKNPVLGHIAASNRDPKVIWHKPTKKWIMALFLDKQDYTLLSSTNLKEWTRICDIPPMGCGECPDIFELPIDGDENNKTWVFWGGNGNYALGTFDGKTFTKTSGSHPSKYGANDYAAQTFSDVPADDGRRIQISWMSGGKYPEMPFNQQMSFPRVLTLRTTEEGVRLFMEPAKEIELLHEKEHAFSNVALRPNENLLEDISGDLFHIVAEFEPGTAEVFGFNIRGNKIEYAVEKKTITALGRSAPLAAKDGTVKLELLVDRTSIELFGNAGRIQMATCFLPDQANRSIGVFAESGQAKIVSLKVYELKSAWPQ